MKNLGLIIITLLAFATTSVSQTYNNPESIVWDEIGKRYFISNKQGNSIVQLDALNKLTNFVTTGLRNPKGLLIVGDTLISVNNTTVQGFLLSDAKQVFNVSIAGSIWMNDVATDKKGNLYVSDSETSKVHKISLKTGQYSTLTTIAGWPNGLFYDAKDNALLICTWDANAKIYSYDLSLSKLNTLISTNLADLDGLARDNCGNLYVSSWGSNTVYAFEPTLKNPPTIVSKGNNGPADISINESQQILAIPNFNANTISLLNLGMGCQKISNRTPLKNSVVVFADSLLLDWNDMSGVGNFEVEYSTDSTFRTSVVLAKSISSNVFLKGLQTNKKYFWRVRPTNSNEKSIFDEVWSFNTTIANSIISHKSVDLKYSVFPNPSTGVFNINIGDTSAKNAKLEVYDFTGKLVFAKERFNGVFDLTGYAEGIYIAKLSVGNDVSYLKIMKE